MISQASLFYFRSNNQTVRRLPVKLSGTPPGRLYMQGATDTITTALSKVASSAHLLFVFLWTEIKTKKIIQSLAYNFKQKL